MNQNIYKNYTDNIKDLLANGQRRGTFEKSSIKNFSGISGSSDRSFQAINENKDISLFNSLQRLSAITGKKTKYNEKPGAHPDFLSIKTLNSIENHYITSMFVDIKNSTGLFKKYEAYTVANITTTIQRAALHTCWYFDGYVQRFHGDGLFIYFGGKNITLAQSVINAVNAASFISYFIQNDLKEVFLEQDVDKIFTRIGIDTGFDKDVLWHLAGIKDCSEITTCSLHTSLASKMQGNADNNGIMLGDNVKDNTNLSSDLFSIKYNQKEQKEERYIFQIPEENFNYTQWVFNWDKFLKNHPSVTSDDKGNLYFKDTTNTPSLNKEFIQKNAQGYRPYFKG